MLYKKVVLFVLVVFVGLTLLVNLSFAQEDITLRFVTTRIDPTMEEAIILFEVDHPNVKVELIPMGEFGGQKARAMILANDLPDMFEVTTGGAGQKNLPVFLKNNLVEPVPEWLKKELDWDENCLDLAKKYYLDSETGKILALPIEYDLKPLFYYRVDALKEVGLDPNNFPTEMMAWWEANKKLMKRDSKGEITRYAMRTFAFVVDYGIDFFLSYVEPKGDPSHLYSYIGGSSPDDPYRLTAPGVIKSLKFYQNMCYGPEQIFDNAYADRVEGLLADFYAGVTGGTWMDYFLGGTGIEYITVSSPHVKGDKPKAIGCTPACGVISTSEHKELSWRFLKILAASPKFWTWRYTPKKIAGSVSSTTVLPAYISIWRTLEESEFEMSRYSYVLTDVQGIVEPKADPVYCQVLLEVLQPMFTAINVEGKDVEEQAAWANTEANRILREAEGG